MAGNRVGCSGWNYDSWRGDLYPEGVGPARWLSLYAQEFDTVEVNSTFYRLASRKAVERWVEQTPPDFTFAVKASRYLTHIKRLRDLPGPIRRFREPLAPLEESGRLGAVLWQLPPDFKRDDDRLDRLLDHLPVGRHAIEFRHPTWFCEEVLERLRQRDVALVLAHHPDRPWQPWELTASFAVVRFHFGACGRRGDYSEAELDEWAARLAPVAAERDLLVYFNNDWEGFAPRNALGLRKRLEVVCKARCRAQAGNGRDHRRPRPLP